VDVSKGTADARVLGPRNRYVPATASRNSQSASVIASTTALPASSHDQRPGINSHLPVQAAASAQGTAAMATHASNVPPTLAAKACTIWPRTACAQAVVIPHEGHRICQASINPQGGNPSCSCVPRPRGSGVSHAATASTLAAANAAAAHDQRAALLRRAESLLGERLQERRRTIETSPKRSKAKKHHRHHARHRRQCNDRATTDDAV